MFFCESHKSLNIMLTVYNIKLNIYNKKCEIDNGDVAMKTREFTTLARVLAILGIAFGSDRLIGYSLLGIGTLLGIIVIIKDKGKRNLVRRKSQ